MKQPISGYHLDEENHWVAELACGHFQHVRHDPPLSTRLWTQTTEGRDSMLGFELNCVKCDEGAPLDQADAGFLKTLPAAREMLKSSRDSDCDLATSTTDFCKIKSLQTGMPQEVSFGGALSSRDAKWTTGFVKQPIATPVWLGESNLVGDGQADTVHHGGPHKAVCAYPADHYLFWRDELNLSLFPFGSFGENFTLAGIEETGVCIGDVWSVGDAEVQVSQPRQPCWKLARRWGIKDLALRVQETGKTGWYFRVLKQGNVSAGMDLKLIVRLNPKWTIAAANRIMHHDTKNLPAARELAAVAELSPSWKQTLTNRALRNVEPNTQARLAPPTVRE